MKITGKNPAIKTHVKTHKAGKELKTRRRPTIDKSTIMDRVNVSGKAKKLARLRKLVEASPDVRAEKVEQIKNSIDEGKYSVKTAKVAEAIIRRAIDFNKNHRYL